MVPIVRDFRQCLEVRVITHDEESNMTEEEMTVRKLIDGEIVRIEPTESLRQAAFRMHDSNVGALALTESGVA